MRFVLLFLAASLLSAKDHYVQPNKKIEVCGRVELEGEIRPGGGYVPNTTGGNKGAGSDGAIIWRTGTDYFQPEKRKDVSQFAVVEESGRSTSLKDLKGKVVVVGLWSTGCEPSLFLLGELAKLQPKGAANGFEIFPVNYDPEGWHVVNKFLRQDRMQKMLAGIKLFRPSLGASGVHQFMDQVPALPTFFIVDREGRFAAWGTGYKDWEVLRWLQFILKEQAAVPVPMEKKEAAIY